MKLRWYHPAKHVLKQLVAKGNKSARGVLKQLEEPEKFLSTIQIGITLIGIVSGAYGGVAIADDLVPFVFSHSGRRSIRTQPGNDYYRSNHHLSFSDYRRAGS